MVAVGPFAQTVCFLVAANDSEPTWSREPTANPTTTYSREPAANPSTSWGREPASNPSTTWTREP